MATYYWVGGSGNWSDATNHWSNASGGSPNASYLPTASDDVIFDANSNTGTSAFTVTVDGTSSSPSLCQNFSTGGAGGALDGTMTLVSAASTSAMDIYGSLTLPATNFSWLPTNGLELGCRGTSTHTITTNGVTINTTNITINGVGGTYSLGSALTGGSGRSVTVTNGTFSTTASNYALTFGGLVSNNSNVRTISLNASALTITGSNAIVFTTSTNLTFNAGTSTITCSAASPTINGGGMTFNNVTFSNNTSGITTITGANTFNNLNQTSRSATGIRQFILSANQTVSGTLTLGAANTAIRRILVLSDTLGTQRTITLNGTLAALADVDFRDINAAGTVATPWTGTRLGNGLNNSNITTDTPKTVYWNLAGSQNWSATGWATTNNGAPGANNFPLPQDTATFTQAGSAGTVTIDVNWWIGSIQMADGVSNRTTAFTLATGTTNPIVYGNVTLFSSLTLSGTGIFQIQGQGVTQSITSAGITWTQSITINAPGGTFKLLDNLTSSSATAFTLTSGTLDVNGKTLTAVLFSSSNSNTRTIAFGTGNITLTGNAATILGIGVATNLTVTGSRTFNSTYSGSTGTRNIQGVQPANGGTEANALDVNITSGSDTVTMGTSSRIYRNINFSGFLGTLSNSDRQITGNLTISAGMTLSAGTLATTFAATSGTQTVTSNGNTMDFPITVNTPGATVKFADAFTQGSTRAFTFSNGTIQFPASATSTTGAFATSGTTQKYLQSTLAGTQATLSQASSTVNATYLTIQDINATGGATWNAYYINNNVDAGDNAGWNFTDSPANVIETGMRLRSFTEPRRF